MKFFVIAKRDNVLPASEFTQLLVSRWAGTKVMQVKESESPLALEFRTPMQHSRLDGSLNRRGSCIAFVADLPDCAEFAHWCRSIVPPHEPLLFCDEGMSGKVELEPTMMATDILRAFQAGGG